MDLLPEEHLEAARELLESLLRAGTVSPLGELAQRATLLEQILDHLPDATLAVDREGKVLVWNRAAEEMTGVRKEEILGKGDYIYAVPFYGKPRPLLVDLVLGDGKEWEKEYEKVERRGDVVAGEGVAPLAFGGRGLYFWSLAAPIYGPDGALMGAVQCIRDIGERKKMEEELKHLSTHDVLTGLYNRAYFEEELRRLEKGRSFPVSFVVCDLDGLKMVNDALGHERGDEILRRAARVIAACVRGSDVVARVGGDEFVVVLPGADRRAAETVADRILEEVERDNLDHPDLPLSLSVGTATAEDASQPLREFYKEADDAMYRDKLARGREPRYALLRVLKTALAQKDFHTERMRELTCALGEAVGLSREEIDLLRLLVDVHDIGKLGVPEQILFKPGPLSAEERKEVERHPEIGYRIALSSPELAPVAELILQHHERWDGSGYPRGLRGKEIHLLSRILAVVDAYEAMTADRPYRRALPHAGAVAELERCAGKQFDPDLVRIFVRLVAGKAGERP
ncbi:MAG: sensor domain-containing diguanylate cyclase/phosphohydrolase, partial [Moorellales bacterium]